MPRLTNSGQEVRRQISDHLIPQRIVLLRGVFHLCDAPGLAVSDAEEDAPIGDSRWPKHPGPHIIIDRIPNSENVSVLRKSI
jgi:hypothetical protein